MHASPSQPVPPRARWRHAGALILALGPLTCAALESDEHREIGNCALAVSQRFFQSMQTQAVNEPQRRLKDLDQAFAELLPEPGGGQPCQLPRNTVGLADWWERLSGNSLQIEADRAGRRVWAAGGAGTAAERPQWRVTYGQLSSLVDSYVLVERILSARPLAGDPATERKRRRSATASDDLPLRAADLFRTGGGLPWPEDVRALDVNDAHFRGLAVVSYQNSHRLAREASAAEAPNFYGALVANAVSDHYLLDLMAPGHVMAARQTVPGESALAMHDYANRVGVRFHVDDGQQRENLARVLAFMRDNAEALFGAGPWGCAAAGAGAPDGHQLGDLAHVNLARQLCDAPRWLGHPIHLRGDNFITELKMADPTLGPAQSRQYLFLVAVQVLSIADAIAPALDRRPGTLCAVLDCAALAQGFGGKGEPSGMSWFAPRPQRTPDGAQISTPQVRVCCGVYEFTEVETGRLFNLYRLSDLSVGAARAATGTEQPRAREDARGPYRYLDSDLIWAADYAREYSKRDGAVAPHTLALSASTLWKSYSGEILDFRDFSGAEFVDDVNFDSAWTTVSLAARVDGRDPRERYGAELRFMRNLGHSPWRWGDFYRYGRYHDLAGVRRSDNGAGLVLEQRTTFFKFAAVVGSRGFPVFDREHRYYGFEVGIFLPSSRIPFIGAK